MFPEEECSVLRDPHYGLGESPFFLCMIIDIANDPLPSIAKNLAEAVLLLLRTKNW